MLWWIETVWTSRNLFGNLRSMLILGHIVESVNPHWMLQSTKDLNLRLKMGIMIR